MIYTSSLHQVLIITSSEQLMINLFAPYELQAQTHLEIKIHMLAHTDAM